LKNVIGVPSFSETLGIQDSVWEHFLMMGTKGGDQDRLFYSFNLDTHVPADHLLRRIDHFLDLSEAQNAALRGRRLWQSPFRGHAAAAGLRIQAFYPWESRSQVAATMSPTRHAFAE
jgi:hypothetical protein